MIEQKERKKGSGGARNGAGRKPLERKKVRLQIWTYEEHKETVREFAKGLNK